MKLKSTCLPFLASAGLLVLPNLVRAQPSAHYVPGVEGLKAATLPPPGIYLRDYNVAYYSDRRNDASGDKIDAADAKAFIYANVPRAIWITGAQVLGGNLGVDGLLPLQYTDLKVNQPPPAGPYDNSTFGIGDFFLEGTWSSHIQQFDFSLGAGAWMPTGDSSEKPPQVASTKAGLGYWTCMFTAGATWYIDKDKKWSLSALNRYEINTEKEGTDIKPGQAYTVEGGVGYNINKMFDVGLVSYYQQQVTADSGTGASNERNRVAAVGAEAGAFYPKVMLGWSLRYLYDFMAESRLQGHTLALTITKAF
jgi:hypothetical protein